MRVKQVIGGGVGEPAGHVPNRLLPDKEVIGPPECPILHRWTLIPWGERKKENKDVRWKLMIHHFQAHADDRDVHDHPRPFITFVVKGYYDDMAPSENGGVVLRERMKPGMVRFRPATHAHRTKVGPNGCWTVVVMGPLKRRWGFWRLGEWYYWKDYESRFGLSFRCEEGS